MTTAAQTAPAPRPTMPAPAAAAARVAASAACAVGLVHLVRGLARRVPDGAVAPWLHVAAAPSLFLLAVTSLSFMASRLVWDWPVGRTVAARWFSESVAFAAASVAMFLLLTMTSSGNAALRARDLGAGFFAMVLPPLTEELSFRGVLAASVASSLTAAVTSHRVRAVLTILICSVAFSVAHENAPSSASWLVRFAPRFGAGVVLGALARRSGSLLPPMLAHAAYNQMARSC